jgi:hypothetical protein
MRAVEDGDIKVIDLWEQGDGLQDNTFVKRKASKMLMELISGGASAFWLQAQHRCYGEQGIGR